MRINQFIARASGLSRRSADGAVDKGRVTVNGKPARKGMKVEYTDAIRLDDRLLQITKFHYVMLYKPVGYLCSRSSQGGTPTIYDLLPPELQRLNSVGRLDKDTSGLLLLSDDGDFAQRMTHPKYNKKKIYLAHLDKNLTKLDIKKLTKGVILDDGRSLLKVLSFDGLVCRLELREGRNRQIRRTFEAIGYTVTQLHRFKLADYELDLPKPGQWKYIEQKN